MAKILYKRTGKIYNISRLKKWAVAGWALALLLSVIMAKGAF